MIGILIVCLFFLTLNIFSHRFFKNIFTPFFAKQIHFFWSCKSTPFINPFHRRHPDYYRIKQTLSFVYPLNSSSVHRLLSNQTNLALHQSIPFIYRSLSLIPHIHPFHLSIPSIYRSLSLIPHIDPFHLSIPSIYRSLSLIPYIDPFHSSILFVFLYIFSNIRDFELFYSHVSGRHLVSKETNLSRYDRYFQKLLIFISEWSAFYENEN